MMSTLGADGVLPLAWAEYASLAQSADRLPRHAYTFIVPDQNRDALAGQDHHSSANSNSHDEYASNHFSDEGQASASRNPRSSPKSSPAAVDVGYFVDAPGFSQITYGDPSRNEPQSGIRNRYNSADTVHFAPGGLVRSGVRRIGREMPFVDHMGAQLILPGQDISQTVAQQNGTLHMEDRQSWATQPGLDAVLETPDFDILAALGEMGQSLEPMENPFVSSDDTAWMDRETAQTQETYQHRALMQPQPTAQPRLTMRLQSMLQAQAMAQPQPMAQPPPMMQPEFMTQSRPPVPPQMMPRAAMPPEQHGIQQSNFTSEPGEKIETPTPKKRKLGPRQPKHEDVKDPEEQQRRRASIEKRPMNRQGAQPGRNQALRDHKRHCIDHNVAPEQQVCRDDCPLREFTAKYAELDSKVVPVTYEAKKGEEKEAVRHPFTGEMRMVKSLFDTDHFYSKVPRGEDIPW